MSQNPLSATFPTISRTEYIKISLSPSEMKVFDLKFKKVNSFFSEKELVLNQNELLRMVMLNLDQPEIMEILSKLYKKEVSYLFGGLKK